MLKTGAKRLPTRALDDYFTNSYGIFGGGQRQWAKLLFNRNAARYVEGEVWHAEQRSREYDDGSYQLEVPYSHSSELIMDVLRHGADVEVLAPKALREDIRKRVETMSRLYLFT